MSDRADSFNWVLSNPKTKLQNTQIKTQEKQSFILLDILLPPSLQRSQTIILHAISDGCDGVII